MFGIEKFDERTQVIALLGGLVVTLSVGVLLFFLFTSVLVKEEKVEVVTQPGQDLSYIAGVIEVTFRERISRQIATDLMSNLGLNSSEPITNPFGRLVYEVNTGRGKEKQWIDRLKKEGIVYDATLKKVR